MELRRWHLASLWIIPGVLICVNLSQPGDGSASVCVRERQKEIKSCRRGVQNTGYIDWLLGWLTWEWVSEWMSGLWKSFLSPGVVFLLFPEKWVCFVFVEINASFFSFYKRQWKTCFFSMSGLVRFPKLSFFTQDDHFPALYTVMCMLYYSCESCYRMQMCHEHANCCSPWGKHIH